jgi:hypothetical protein
VEWEPGEARDPDGDFPMWDYLGVHHFNESFDKYLASRYMAGKGRGQLQMFAPPEPGKYMVTATRDLGTILEYMNDVSAQEKYTAKKGWPRVPPGDPRTKELEARLNAREDQGMHPLVPLGCVTFTVMPRRVVIPGVHAIEGMTEAIREPRPGHAAEGMTEGTSGPRLLGCAPILRGKHPSQAHRRGTRTAGRRETALRNPSGSRALR